VSHGLAKSIEENANAKRDREQHQTYDQPFHLDLMDMVDGIINHENDPGRMLTRQRKHPQKKPRVVSLDRSISCSAA